MRPATLGEKVIAIGHENATVTIEEAETEMTGGEEMIAEGTATGTWPDGIEIAMSINVVTESGTMTTAIDAETGRTNGEDGTGEINHHTFHYCLCYFYVFKTRCIIDVRSDLTYCVFE
jgi:hypothetical protein